MAAIAVIDDDPAIRNWLVAVLRTARHVVRAFDSAEAAVPAIRAEVPDLIVSDIRLPGMSGLEMLELLRQDPATITVPLILITSVGHRQIYRQGMELGADDFITKPFTVDEVVRAIDARLARTMAVRAAELVRTMPAQPQDPPARIGRFRIEKRLARGVGTELFLGRDAAGMQAAIKLLPAAGQGGKAYADFMREMDIAGAVRHPNLASVLDKGVDTAGPYVAFEYFPLGDLAGLLSRGIAPHLAFRVVAQVAAGLEALHAAGIVHRDIKPANIMVRSAHAFVVTDFGTAKALAFDADLTPNGQVVGTPTYISPEQITRKPVGPQSDIYSLGVVLYELLSGQKPFAGTDYHQVLHAHLMTVPPPLPARLARFQALIDRMLAKDPSRRQPDMATLRREIDELAF